jgi:hypothetical protein
MDWLGSALAFALTMLALSLVVTTTVETIHRVVGLREKGLRLMMAHFYDRVIESHVLATLPTHQKRDEFLDGMTTNRAPAGAERWHLLSRVWSGDKLGSLSLDDFMGRLGDSDFGDAIARIGDDVGSGAIDTVLRDIAHKFEEFGREASVYFEARARLLSVLVAFVIAWQFYVHPYDLFTTFLQNPAVVAHMIDKAPEIVEQSQKAEQRLDATMQQLAQEAGTADDAGTKQRLEEIRSNLETVKATRERVIGSLAAAGVPIGWTPKRLADAHFTRSFLLIHPAAWSLQAAASSAWLLLGGLLVGLGGPFWRDLVLSLTRLRGGAATERRKAEAKDAREPGSDRIAVAAERFRAASQARAVVAGDPTGQIDFDLPVG